MNTFINDVRFNFLFIDRYSFGRTWVYPESRLPYNMLRYIIKGSAAFFVDKEEVRVHPGEIIYLPQDSTLSCHALGDEFEFYSIRFAASVQYGGGNILEDYYQIPTVVKDQEGQAREYFEHIYNWVRAEEQSKMFWVRGYLDSDRVCHMQGEDKDSCDRQRAASGRRLFAGETKTSDSEVGQPDGFPDPAGGGLSEYAYHRSLFCAEDE